MVLNLPKLVSNWSLWFCGLNSSKCNENEWFFVILRSPIFEMKGKSLVFHDSASSNLWKCKENHWFFIILRPPIFEMKGKSMVFHDLVSSSLWNARKINGFRWFSILWICKILKYVRNYKLFHLLDTGYVKKRHRRKSALTKGAEQSVCFRRLSWST